MTYIGVSGDRVTPFPDEINARKLKDAASDVKLFMRNTLDDPKWDNLKSCKTKRGKGSIAYLIPIYNSGRIVSYYSEKHFSLGELCALKLAIKISTIKEKSLLLIDEVEMALHPQAQIRMMRMICQIADEKKLTILFSTHSSSIIKTIHRKKLLYLKSNDKGEIAVHQNVFPAQILGEIAFDDELNADFIFYVEDEQAKYLLEKMLDLYFSFKANEKIFQPLFKITPVGGFVQVIQLLSNSTNIFPAHVKRFAFLDEDVKLESLAELEKNEKFRLLYEKNKKNVNFLPCTPEVGLIDFFENQCPKSVDLTSEVNHLFPGSVINIKHIINSSDYLKIENDTFRKKCKVKLQFITNSISKITNLEEVTILRYFYTAYCRYNYADKAILFALLGPVINSQ